jgi:hypothetical protein
MSFDGILDLDLASIITIAVLFACGVLIWYANRPSVLRKYQAPTAGTEAKEDKPVPAPAPRRGKFAPRGTASR